MSGNKRRKEQEALIQASYRYAWSLNPNRHGAEDLVHDAWIKVSKRYGPVPDKALMFRAIRNLYIDGYRHAQRIRLLAFDEQDPVWHELADAPDTELAIDSGHLMEALARLRVVEREALFLSVVEGYTASEIACMTDCPRSTALSLLHRARKKMRTWLSEAGANPFIETSVKRAGS